ncbi:MAG: 50S ribosomal protein L13 [Elusimicrobia bacterium RIFOXYA2_FULL_58_8]|nr:MAG: 50S ribosomal protein L13 [Elusimicrobia bacterium RIFOXYA12_FULL_57_11]OGS13745.1 MAG: 50S ribosomal protein L13 [Elusimicrobia bacterium RIFOXYA2_FULL_58_8]
MITQRTTLPKADVAEKTRKWHFFDAADQVLGRLSTKIAVLLMGKHKRDYAHNTDCGDFVVVTNIAKIRFTGNKIEQKFYFRHSGYANGATTIPLKRQMENDPTRVLELSVRRMLDDNRLRNGRMKRLRMFAGTQTQFPDPRLKAVKAAKAA